METKLTFSKAPISMSMLEMESSLMSSDSCELCSMSPVSPPCSTLSSLTDVAALSSLFSPRKIENPSMSCRLGSPSTIPGNSGNTPPGSCMRKNKFQRAIFYIYCCLGCGRQLTDSERILIRDTLIFFATLFNQTSFTAVHFVIFFLFCLNYTVE